MSEAPQPLLQRIAVRYFEQRSASLPRSTRLQTDAIHALNVEERAQMRRVERGAVVRSALSGAGSAMVAAVAEVLAKPLVPEGTPLFSKASLTYWAIVGAAIGVSAVAEIAFMTWDALRSTHALATAAGIELFGVDRQSSDRALVEALARAALELPNPIRDRRGVDPRRESSKARLFLVSVAYKAKVGVTSFVLKLVLRKILARAVVRGTLQNLLPFVAVPVTAAWNAVVTRWVLREARIRAMGPSAVKELVELVFADAHEVSEAGRTSAVRAVAASIVRTQDLHPNLSALLDAVLDQARRLEPVELDDVGGFLGTLPQLSAYEQRLSLQVLAIACIVDGRFSQRERQLWLEALRAVGRPVEWASVEALRAAFVRGDGVADDVIRAM